MDRYSRQRTVSASCDARFAATRILLVGVGGTGAPLANALVRAGVGRLILLDPDTVSETDLARQHLYHSEDAVSAAPKIDCALRELTRIGGRSALEGDSIALHPRNAAEWVTRADLVVDATDHLPARSWIDAACRAEGVPWLHLAAIEDRFVVIPFFGAEGPCFRCYCPEDPPASALGTCETRGVLPAATALAAAHGFSAIWGWVRKTPESPPTTRTVTRGRVGEAELRTSTLQRDPACPACAPGSGLTAAEPTFRVICGRSRLEGWTRLERGQLIERLRTREALSPGEQWRIEEPGGEGVVRAVHGNERLTYFSDGRVVYGPIEEIQRAEQRVRELLAPPTESESSPRTSRR